MKYTDEQRIEKIRNYTVKLIKYIEEKGITKEMLLTDETIRWAVTTPLYNIGEHAYNLTKEFKELNADIPWGKISGLRHRLIHDYEDTNWTIISEIVFTVIPEFERQLSGIKYPLQGSRDNIG